MLACLQGTSDRGKPFARVRHFHAHGLSAVSCVAALECVCHRRMRGNSRFAFCCDLLFVLLLSLLPAATLRVQLRVCPWRGSVGRLFEHRCRVVSFAGREFDRC